MSVTNIPNTNYTIQNNQIHDKDGNAVSKEAFVNDVKTKNIVLTGAAFKVLGDTFGTEYQNTLAKTSEVNTQTLQTINEKLNSTENSAGDITLTILEMIHKTRQTQKKSLREIANAQVEMQKATINKQASQMKAAAIVGLATGLATAGIQFVASATQVKGGVKAMNAKTEGAQKAINLKTAGQAGKLNALGAVVKASGDGTVGIMNADAKKLDGVALDHQHRTDEAKKMRDNADETEKKARETLQAVLNARDQAMSKAVNMS